MAKEVASYEKEASSNEARVQKMRDEGKDEYDIKKQEEVLQETEAHWLPHDVAVAHDHHVLAANSDIGRVDRLENRERRARPDGPTVRRPNSPTAGVARRVDGPMAGWLDGPAALARRPDGPSRPTARRPDGLTARWSDGWTARRPDGPSRPSRPTARWANSPTGQQPNGPTGPRPNSLTKCFIDLHSHEAIPSSLVEESFSKCSTEITPKQEISSLRQISAGLFFLFCDAAS